MVLSPDILGDCLVRDPTVERSQPGGSGCPIVGVREGRNRRLRTVFAAWFSSGTLTAHARALDRSGSTMLVAGCFGFALCGRRRCSAALESIIRNAGSVQLGFSVDGLLDGLLGGYGLDTGQGRADLVFAPGGNARRSTDGLPACFLESRI